ncbi:hypothetical protein YPPY09_3690, partial [Yersinia pestis PY-09]|jgi:hypothetical protein
MGSP